MFFARGEIPLYLGHVGLSFSMYIAGAALLFVAVKATPGPSLVLRELASGIRVFRLFVKPFPSSNLVLGIVFWHL